MTSDPSRVCMWHSVPMQIRGNHALTETMTKHPPTMKASNAKGHCCPRRRWIIRLSFRRGSDSTPSFRRAPIELPEEVRRVPRRLRTDAPHAPAMFASSHRGRRHHSRRRQAHSDEDRINLLKSSEASSPPFPSSAGGGASKALPPPRSAQSCAYRRRRSFLRCQFGPTAASHSPKRQSFDCRNACVHFVQCHTPRKDSNF